MGYIYECDWCDHVEHEDRPALTAEFNEQWYESTKYGDLLRQAGYEPGDLVTFCPDCVAELLLENDGP